MAVRALLHYGLEVPDQTVGEKFYTSFGLVDEGRRDGAVALRPAPLKRETVLLYGGPRKRLHHLAFGAPGDDFAATKESLRRAGVSQVDPPRGAPEGRASHRGWLGGGGVAEIAGGAGGRREGAFRRGWGRGRRVAGSNFSYNRRAPGGWFAEHSRAPGATPGAGAGEPRAWPEADAL